MFKKLAAGLKNVRGVVVRLLLPWNEGLILTPDFGHDKVVNVLYFTWLFLHFRVILKDQPLPIPAPAPPAQAK